MQVYSSFSINFQKYLRSLSQSKFRKKLNRYIAEGDKICQWIIEKKPEDIEYLVCTDKWIQSLDSFQLPESINIIRTDEKSLKAFSQLSNGSEVIIIAYQNLKTFKDVLKPKFKAVYLDDVQDPGNVGTIIRTAAWLNFDAVIRSLGSADFYNPKVIQSAMGSHVSIPLISQVIHELDLTNINLAGTLLSGTAMGSQLDLGDRVVIVIGNESKGIRSETKELLTSHLLIPGDSTKAESLNAAVAFGIIASRV
jgi:TrmH family RNA methyltransferase